jgi:haloacetate dehalogenase
MFEGFDEFDITTTGTTIHGRRRGSGPPLLLLHGMPETHLMWHACAPILAADFTVVVTDLRGFGDSGRPPSTPDHAPYSMREIARDQVEVMQELGFGRFAVAGHDRGGRCAYRMALDHPAAVSALAVLDIIPTADAFARADSDFCLGFWIWSFLAAPFPVPEQFLGSAPSVIVDHMLDDLGSTNGAFPPAVRAEYVRKLSSPRAIHAVCEEYRAAATLDVQHDEADRGRHAIACPVLALWSRDGAVGQWYDPLDVWRAWAPDVRGEAMDAGHFLPEEAPVETARLLGEFLRA